MKFDLDSKINHIENVLTNVSACPVVGTLAGGVKVVLGAAQGLTGLLGCLFLVAPAVYTNNWSLVKHSWTHVKHGAGNILAGTAESIPIVQTALFGIRKFRVNREESLWMHVHTTQENKFMPYSSLVKQHMQIMGGEEASCINAQSMLKSKIQEAGGEDKISLKKKFKFAREAIKVHDPLQNKKSV